MINLLEETLEVLHEHGKDPNDVKWVGTTDEYSISWDEFVKIANVEYDSGYGAAEIATDLTIVGVGFYMTRDEYDGAEWWEFHSEPKQPTNPKPFSRVYDKCKNLWPDLKELNSEDENE